MKAVALSGLVWMSSGCWLVPTYGDVTSDEFMERFEALSTSHLCRQAFECPTDEPGVIQTLLRFESLEACSRSRDVVRTLRPEWHARSIRMLGFGIDQEHAAKCLAELEARHDWDACSLDSKPRGCGHEVYIGTGDMYDACQTNLGCKPGLECWPPGYPDCGGQCLDFDSIYPFPSCGDETCARDERCGQVGAEPPRCLPKLKQGAQCQPQHTDLCETPTRCLPDEGSDTTGTCVTVSTLDAGDYCAGVNGMCTPGLRCGDDDRCVPTPRPPMVTIPEGGGCAWFANTCDPGLTCLGDDPGWSGQCGVTRKRGETCHAHTHCEPHLACLTASGDSAWIDEVGTCEPPAPVGARCWSNFACASGVCDTTCQNGSLEICDYP